jgi:hypothetical protein
MAASFLAPEHLSFGEREQVPGLKPFLCLSANVRTKVWAYLKTTAKQETDKAIVRSRQQK